MDLLTRRVFTFQPLFSQTLNSTSMIVQLKKQAKKWCSEPLWKSAADTWAFLKQARIKGCSIRLNFPDRVLLEDVILPGILENSAYQRILFVGCDWYTKSYPKMFKNREFWTMEIDPAKSRYGSQRHVVDGVQAIMRHFEENYFDVIVHTGVFGWGLNERRDVEVCFEGCFRSLRPGGMLVLGWDDVPEHRPFRVTEECVTLQQFDPMENSPLGVSEYLVADDSLRHTFTFYVKPLEARHVHPEIPLNPDASKNRRMNSILGCFPFAEGNGMSEAVVAQFESVTQLIAHFG